MIIIKIVLTRVLTINSLIIVYSGVKKKKKCINLLNRRGLTFFLSKYVFRIYYFL